MRGLNESGFWKCHYFRRERRREGRKIVQIFVGKWKARGNTEVLFRGEEIGDRF